jgi:hypothetical protein
MSPRRRLCTILPLLIGFPSFLRAQSANEIELREILLDSRAFLDAGSFSYNDYSARATAVAVQLDRYKRRDGKDEHLIAASGSFIRAKVQWEDFFEKKREHARIEAITGGATSRELILLQERDLLALLDARTESWAQFRNSLEKYIDNSTQRKTKQTTKK